MMNLTRDPWIPALRSNGSRALFSLQDLFEQAHEIRDLAVKPHERVALMRLLLCISQAALNGPSDEDEWASCSSKIQDSAKNYLDKWSGEFELLGNGSRFLQAKPGTVSIATPAMSGEGLSRLNLCMASGESNPTHFDNTASEARVFSNEDLALNLLTYQCYSPLLGRGYKGRSPCGDSNMLHTYIIGNTLLKTISLNLITQATIKDVYSCGFGRPIWEIPLGNLNSTANKNSLKGSYLGRLVPLARSIWIDSPKTMTLTNGLEYGSFFESRVRESASTVVAGKEDIFLLRAQTNKAIWRELSAVCVRLKGADGVSGPLAFRNLLPRSNIIIWSGGLISDLQAKVIDFVEATYLLPQGMLSEVGRNSYESGVKFAVTADQSLFKAITAYSKSLKLEKPAYDKARQQFWTLVEQSLGSLFELSQNISLAADLANSPWGKAVKASAASAYERTCSHQTPRQIEAYALGLRRLNFTPKPSQPQKTVA